MRIKIDSISQATKSHYANVLPKGLQLFYSENDSEILDLRSRAALLDAILKKTLSEMDDEGSSVNSEVIRLNANILQAGIPKDSPLHKNIQIIVDELNRAAKQEILESKTRKLIQEIVEVVKAETNRLVAIGGALTLSQVGAIVNGIMQVALKFLDPDTYKKWDSANMRALAMIETIRRQVINTPELEELRQAASITPRYKNDD